MFESIYQTMLNDYYKLRSSVLSLSARKHEFCYLLRFDRFLSEHVTSYGRLDEELIELWISTLSGKSSSIENEVIVIRQFLHYLMTSGEKVFIPAVPKVHEDYVPYIFSDDELCQIFDSADNIVLHDHKADPLIVIEFPVILRLLYSCGLRIGETIRIELKDIDLNNGMLMLINTKGDKQRIVPMSDGMIEILSCYIGAMGLQGKKERWLFPSGNSEGHISDRSVKHRFEYILAKNAIRLDNRKKHERGPCLHCMRHVFAFKSFTRAEREGRHLDDAIPFLSIYLGHDSLYETEKYLKFSNELFPETIDIYGSYMEGLFPEVNYEA